MYLTDAKVKNAKPKEGKPLKLADGGGLYLYVSTTGAKSRSARSVWVRRRSVHW